MGQGVWVCSVVGTSHVESGACEKTEANCSVTGQLVKQSLDVAEEDSAACSCL